MNKLRVKFGLEDSVICSLHTCRLTLIKRQRGTTAWQAIIKRQLCQRQSLGLLHIHWAVKLDKQQHIANTKSNLSQLHRIAGINISV